MMNPVSTAAVKAGLSGTPKMRVQFEVNISTLIRLDDIKDRIGVSARVDVIRAALTLYLWLSDQREAGHRMRIIKTAPDGTEIEVALPGLGFD